MAQAGDVELCPLGRRTRKVKRPAARGQMAAADRWRSRVEPAQAACAGSSSTLVWSGPVEPRFRNDQSWTPECALVVTDVSMGAARDLVSRISPKCNRVVGGSQKSAGNLITVVAE